MAVRILYETRLEEKGVTAHIGKMRNGAKMRETICPNFPATFRNIANLKLRMINSSCAYKQPGATTVPWEDIVEHNRTLEEPIHAEGEKTRTEELSKGRYFAFVEYK